MKLLRFIAFGVSSINTCTNNGFNTWLGFIKWKWLNDESQINKWTFILMFVCCCCCCFFVCLVYDAIHNIMSSAQDLSSCVLNCEWKSKWRFQMELYEKRISLVFKRIVLHSTIEVGICIILLYMSY